MRWAEKQRIDFIISHIKSNGTINRKDVMDKFEVSVAQAAVDFRTVLSLKPGLMKYNTSKKTYELVDHD